LEKRKEQVLPGSEGVRRKRRDEGQWGEIAQTLYVHMNK
jgi:hypothetical protein